MLNEEILCDSKTLISDIITVPKLTKEEFYSDKFYYFSCLDVNFTCVDSDVGRTVDIQEILFLHRKHLLELYENGIIAEYKLKKYDRIISNADIKYTEEVSKINNEFMLALKRRMGSMNVSNAIIPLESVINDLIFINQITLNLENDSNLTPYTDIVYLNLEAVKSEKYEIKVVLNHSKSSCCIINENNKVRVRHDIELESNNIFADKVKVYIFWERDKIDNQTVFVIHDDSKCNIENLIRDMRRMKNKFESYDYELKECYSNLETEYKQIKAEITICIQRKDRLLIDIIGTRLNNIYEILKKMSEIIHNLK
jgi:thiamine phosphate synthase YjbQ (UPF0047 family)